MSDPDVPLIHKEAGHIGKSESPAFPRSVRGVGATMTRTIDRPARVGVISTRPAPCLSWVSATSTWPGWSLMTSTRRAVCLAVPSSCSSKTAPPMTTWREPGQPSSSGRRRCCRRGHLQLDQRGHQDARGRRRPGCSSSIRSNTRTRSATPSSFAPGRCRPSRSSRCSPG